MMKFRFFLLTVLLLSFFQNLCVAKELTLKEQSDLSLEVFQMSQSIDALTQQLKAQQSRIDEYQKLQAAISYLSFRSRSIEILQYELRFKKERQEAVTGNIERAKAELDNWDRDNEILQSNNALASKNETQILEERLERMQEILEELDSEIIKLENEIQAAKNDLSSFETYVQERLELIN